MRLSGLVPDQDIKIEFTGLRPGEKLYEELLIDEKNLVRTENDRIFVVRMGEINAQAMCGQIHRLIDMAYNETRDIRQAIQQIVPEYRMRGEENHG